MKSLTHHSTLHPSFKIKCCVDRSRPPRKADTRETRTSVKCHEQSSKTGARCYYFDRTAESRLALGGARANFEARELGSDRESPSREGSSHRVRRSKGPSMTGQALMKSHLHQRRSGVLPGGGFRIA